MSEDSEEALIAAAIVLHHAKAARQKAKLLGDRAGADRATDAIANARGWLDSAAAAHSRSRLTLSATVIDRRDRFS